MCLYHTSNSQLRSYYLTTIYYKITMLITNNKYNIKYNNEYIITTNNIIYYAMLKIYFVTIYISDKNQKYN